MIIIVHSAESDNTILANIGAPDYSYYFVMKKFRTVLGEFARVVEVKKPDLQVDAIYETCRLRGEACMFLSFTPPHKTAVGLRCPTISVFAWEYFTIPTDTWSTEPRNDWRYVFRQHGCSITHSSFAVKTVKQAMGVDFPVWSIPAPVWDDYAQFYEKEKTPIQSRGVDLTVDGTFIDFNGCNVPFVSEHIREDFIEQRSFPQKGKKRDATLHLRGVVYTSVFNPGDNRKNWQDLVKGFIWAFREQEDVALVLKVVHHNFEEARRDLADEIFKLMPFKCRVVILHGYLKDNAYARLVQATTYIVNSAHGEGQCLPLMEFMSAGKPAIAPAHTAMEDYICEDNAFVVKSSLERTHWPHDPRYALRTMRYRINWESLYHAYLESYRVALNDPLRYQEMAVCAVESLRKYCSKAVAEERLKLVFRHLGMEKESLWLVVKARIADALSGAVRFLRLLPRKTRFFISEFIGFIRVFLSKMMKQAALKILHLLKILLTKVRSSWHQN